MTYQNVSVFTSKCVVYQDFEQNDKRLIFPTMACSDIDMPIYNYH